MQPDRAPHQSHDARRNREPQAGPAMLAAGRIIDLGEPLKNPGLLSGQCRTRVVDGEATRAWPSSARSNSTCSVTEPAAVNLIALPTRFTSTCRSRGSSASKSGGRFSSSSSAREALLPGSAQTSRQSAARARPHPSAPERDRACPPRCGPCRAGRSARPAASRQRRQSWPVARGSRRRQILAGQVPTTRGPRAAAFAIRG